jgi:DNA-binding NarL/FixJ family response regulator
VNTRASIECCSWTKSLPRVEMLTNRELEVFAKLAQGASNQTIADDLRISERTVRGHLTNIMRKLGLATRLHACIASYVYFHVHA